MNKAQAEVRDFQQKWGSADETGINGSKYLKLVVEKLQEKMERDERLIDMRFLSNPINEYACHRRRFYPERFLTVLLLITKEVHAMRRTTRI